MIKELMGTWFLKDSKYILTTGERLYPFGEIPTGLLMYDPNGWMSVHLTPLVEGHYHGYFGRYEVFPEDKIIKHYMQHCSDAHLAGSTQIREFDLSGDLLTLTARNLAVSDTQVAELISIEWERQAYKSPQIG